MYYQCNFSDENSINTYNKGEHTSLNQILNRFSDNVNNLTQDEIEIILNRYIDKGEFLKADTLILFCYNKREYRILALDTSVFSLKSEQDLTNLEFVELIKGKLIRELNYLRSKSVFSQLRIDTGEGNDLAGLFPSDLKDYFTAFKYPDKESAKLIQAGGYAYSFWKFLEEKEILPQEAKLVISAVGYSDRGISTITVKRENINLLAPCYEIYKHDSSIKEIHIARQKVLELIKRQAERSFKGGKQFINDLSNIPINQTTVITHQEQLDDFCNTVGKIPLNLATQLQLNPDLDLRNAHNELIQRALLSDDLYVFLTGNPGIGKTTAIADFLKAHKDEGFLFFYVSPA